MFISLCSDSEQNIYSLSEPADYPNTLGHIRETHSSTQGENGCNFTHKQ